MKEPFSTIKLNSNRLESIDFLRGIASLSVVLFHITHTKNFLNPEGIVYNLFKDGGEFGVIVFFVISGFIIPYSMDRSGYKIKDFKPFLFKRIIRIEPVYILSILFMASVMVLLSKMPEIYWGWSAYKLDFTNFLMHLGYVINILPDENWINPVYWTLGIEFQYYIFIGLIFPVFIWKNKWVNFACLFFISAVCWFIFIYFMKDTYLRYGSLIFRSFPVFLVGISLFQLRTERINLYAFIVFNLCILALISTEFQPRAIIAIIFALIVLFTMKKSPRFFLFLGQISFSMYLIHIPIETFFTKLIIPHFQNDLHRTILIFLTLVPIVGFSWLFYEFIEKPCLRLSKKIKYN